MSGARCAVGHRVTVIKDHQRLTVILAVLSLSVGALAILRDFWSRVS